MPYADPERARAYFREYRRTRRAGDTRSTPVQPAVSVEFRLETAGDVIALIENQVQAVLDGDIDEFAQAYLRYKAEREHKRGA